MQQKTTRRLSVAFGIFMAVLLGLSAILPLFTQNATQPVSTASTPTETPAPTFPAPITEFSGISFDRVYLHPSGLFTVAAPTGWEPTQPNNTGVQAQSNFNNGDALSVIEAYVEELTAPLASLDELSARFNQQTLAASWARYTSGWEELARVQEDNRIVIDFEARRAGQVFLARQAIWTEGNYVYSVRIVTPNNAINLLNYMLEEESATLQLLPQFAGTPLAWNASYDTNTKHILRYPETWAVTDNAPGQPVSIEDGLGETYIRIEARQETIADEEAASAFAESLRDGITVASVLPVTREGADGFSVAYNFSNVDGAGQSGLVVLLNGADGTLHVANGVLSEAGIDLNSEEAKVTYPDITGSLATFSLLDIPNLLVDSSFLPNVPPVFMPPTPEATFEATSESTAEATDAVEATLEVTEDAEATAEATPEGTEASN